MTNEEFIRTCSTDELVKSMRGKADTCFSCGFGMASGKKSLCGDRCVVIEGNAKKWLKMEHIEIHDEEVAE